MTATVSSSDILKAAQGKSALPTAALKLAYSLRDFDSFPLAALLQQANPALYQQCQTTMTRTRDYANRHLHGRVEGWDQYAGQHHDFIPWPAIDAALPYGFLSQNLPRPLGGGGCGPLPTGLFTEEISAADAGMFVVYGAHGLALALLISTLDLGLLAFITHEITEGERAGKAVILALAHTEPGGGSDVEDGEDIKTARVQSRCTKVAGGWRLNARKVFISNGSIASYLVVTAWGDTHNPATTSRAFIIPGNTPGVTVGRLEHKMGQRLSTAAEIICEDVFVPDAMSTALDSDRNIDTILTLTRGPVGAMSTGIVRGVLERTLAYLAQKRVRGHWLFEEQWVQLALSEMLATLQAGRGLYMDASMAAEFRGIGRFMAQMPLSLPRSARNNPLFRQLLASPHLSRSLRALYLRQVSKASLQQQVGHSSMAKFLCSDMAVQTAMKGMEILGEDASDTQWGVEKCLRDAKLAQIFEGTNQINRLHVARGFLERS